MTIKIYGNGWVGKAMHTLFPEAKVHDPFQGLISEEVCDIAFVCVPTPLKDGKLDSSIVEEVVSEAKEDLIIIRSTVNPGDSDRFAALYNKKIVSFKRFFQGDCLIGTMNLTRISGARHHALNVS